MIKTKTMEKFSRKTIAFLEKAGRQKRTDWLEKNQEEYDEVLRSPLMHLADIVHRELRALAPDYHFPRKGIGRLKRPSHAVKERGGKLFKNWMTYSAARPRVSRFEHNPNLFFLINSEDKKDPILVAGGLYMPSSQQIRKIREAIAKDASAFDRLFSSKEFKKRFPEGFSEDKKSKRPPRGFDPEHKRIEWLKLQAFFVWRRYSVKEFSSADFPRLVSQDFKQILRFNRLLEAILLGGGLPTRVTQPKSSLLKRLENFPAPRREVDF